MNGTDVRGMPDSVEGIERLAADEGWRDARCEWPTNPHGFWRRGRDGVEYHLSLITAARFQRETAFELSPYDPAKLLWQMRGRETARNWWTIFDIAETGFRDLPDDEHDIKRLAFEENWRHPKHQWTPSTPDGCWRVCGGLTQYHIRILVHYPSFAFCMGW
jgi:hypothetical protein